MWTAPSPQDHAACFDQIACVHMSDLSNVLVHERLPRRFLDAKPNPATFSAIRFNGEFCVVD